MGHDVSLGPDAYDVLVRFLRGCATAQDLIEVNISAGNALQELGETLGEYELFEGDGLDD